MKITSIGNNFGAGPIELNTFQNEKLVVLNSKFSFNNKTDSFALYYYRFLDRFVVLLVNQAAGRM